MKVDEITPDIDSGALLPGAPFAEAYADARSDLTNLGLQRNFI